MAVLFLVTKLIGEDCWILGNDHEGLPLYSLLVKELEEETSPIENIYQARFDCTRQDEIQLVVLLAAPYTEQG